jgi:enoyl-CoA hydratase/carnithine racemase
MELGLHADNAIASERANFNRVRRRQTDPRRGNGDLPPRTVGLHTAVRFRIRGEQLDGFTAFEWGLVSRVADYVELDAEVAVLAGRLASSATATSQRHRG